MASTKSSRIPPTNYFENYVLTRTVSSDAGLFPSAYRSMKDASGSGTYSEFVSNIIPIGFNFNFDTKVYTGFVAATDGWVALIEKSISSFSLTDIFTSNRPDRNDFISDIFSNQHALLCPWFDNLAGVSNQTGYSSDIASGIELPGIGYNPTRHSEYAVKYKNTTSPDGQRCLVIRWTCVSISSLLRFDVVLYENGKIEFRYQNRKDIGPESAQEGATVGIFLNDNRSWRFRDFSTGLGYNDQYREIYEYGGSVYGSYLDGTLPYNYRLKPAQHWPGLNDSGCIYTFIPPYNRKKGLPRKDIGERDTRASYPLVARTGDKRLGNFLRAFDDRKSIAYTPSKANFPTTIPRFYGDTESGITERQAFFSQSGIEFNMTASKNASENFIYSEPKEYIQPYSEDGRYVITNTNDSFFSGSDVSLFGFSLTSPLRSKTQIQLSLPIDYPTTLQPVTSTIHYYNATARGFFMPRGTKYSDVVYDPSIYLTLESYPEDARGFGAIGNSIASGSNPSAVTTNWQSDNSIKNGNGFTMDDQTGVLTKYFAKSVQNNSDYNAQSSEQFTIPINHPFLIEKAIIEIPFTMGGDWFNDKTTSGSPVDGIDNILYQPFGVDRDVFDFAGPAITVSLFNQIVSEDSVYRDLILTGTIIPEGDNVANVKLTRTGNSAPLAAGDKFTVFSPEGFLSYGATPAAVISPNVGSTFTGSVQINCVPAISNGAIVSFFDYSSDFDNTGAQVQINQDFITSYLTSPFTNVNAVGLGVGVSTLVKDIDPFGRNAKGSSPSGRSVFGKEYITFQKSQGQKGGSFPNPLFVSSSLIDFPTYLKDAIDESPTGFAVSTAIPLMSTVPSPYLVMPGDKLTLAISKMRPVLFSRGTNPLDSTPLDIITGSYKHDVSISTGSIKITLYGSLLSSGIEYHQGLNQPTNTNQIHGFIGDNPVLDQYESEYDGTYMGSYTDHYITGSMLVQVQISNRTYLRPGENYYQSRGRVFSKHKARSKGTPDTSTYESNSNSSKSFRLQPWFERVGNQRFVSINCEAERYYDSVMPSFTECLREDGNRIISFRNAAGNFLDGAKIPNDIYNGFNFFDGYGSSANETALLYNNKWTWSYPFEPRYSGVTRILDVFSSLTTKFQYDLSTGNGSFVNPITIKNYFPIMINHQNNSNDFYPKIQSDINVISSLNVQMNKEDLTKCLFGFGDKNTINYDNSTKTKRAGNNHLPEFRNWSTSTVTVPIDYQVGPVIRGWKYGVVSGLPTYSRCIWRRGKYGQFRDMLEQRPFTKYYNNSKFQTTVNDKNQSTTFDGPVTVKFVDSNDKVVKPENTWSQNLSLAATSSMPYFDGETRNRGEINVGGISSTQVLFGSDGAGNIFI